MACSWPQAAVLLWWVYLGSPAVWAWWGHSGKVCGYTVVPGWLGCEPGQGSLPRLGQLQFLVTGVTCLSALFCWEEGCP